MKVTGCQSHIHYGALNSIDDYFQEGGRGERSGDNARSVVYWKPIDCPVRKDLVTTRDKEVADGRRYLANTDNCRRFWLLDYFGREYARTKKILKMCCDVCHVPATVVSVTLEIEAVQGQKMVF